MKHRILGILILLLALLTLFACEATEESAYKIKVLLAYPDNAIQAEQIYVYVTPGEDATFPLTIAEGYEYVDNDAGAFYYDGVLTLENVQYPTTISLDLIKLESSDPTDETLPPPDPVDPGPSVEPIPVSYQCQSQPGGSISSSLASGTHYVGDTVTVKATPADGQDFIGWSLNKDLLSGGTPVSEEEAYTFQLAQDTLLIANFKSSDQAIVYYHLNGGRTSDGASVYIDTYPLTYYYYPNAAADLDTFVRNGHTLLEYSENEDGSGFVTCPGGKIFMDTSKIIHLWAQWSEWSKAELFTTVSVDGGVYIKEYLGNETTVSVPGTIAGKPVLGIKSGAFEDSVMETLILNKSIQVIEDKAFRRCQKLNTVYMCDSIVTLSDAIFDKCNDFKNFRYNAATKPVYSSGWGAYIRKFERVVYYYYQGADIMAVLSGSSSLYGLDSPLMEDLMAKAGYTYTVCNMGVQAGIPQMIYLEFLTHFTDEGDLIIQAPEISSSTWGVTINERTLSMLESGYNVFRYLDASRYRKLFSMIQTVNKERSKASKTTYYAPRKDINIYGDRIPESKKQGSQYQVFDERTTVVKDSTLNRTYAANFNEMYKIFRGQGVTVYFTFAPLNKNCYKSTPQELEAYHAAIDKELLAPRISDFTDFLLDRQYIYNSDKHPTDEGAVIRTNILAGHIIAQLKRDGIQQ